MASQQAITLNENNDENVLATLTTNQPSVGTALNITGMTVEAFLKVSKATADSDPGTWKGSSATTGVTVINAANGQVEVVIPAANINTSMGWWRVDVINGTGKRKTAVYGVVTVTDL